MSAPWVTWNVDNNILNTIGILGTVVTLFFFLSPANTIAAIARKGSTEHFRGEAFQFLFFNCFLWVIYAIFQGGLLFTIISNSTGVFLSVVYVCVFASNLRPPKDAPEIIPYTTTRSYLTPFFTALAAFGLLAGIVQLPMFDFKVGGQKFAAFLFGLIVNIVCVMMYGAPLGIMKQVIVTKSVKYMPFIMIIFTIIVSIFWSSYGIYVGDIWICIPNWLGLLLSLAQLFLYAMYYRNSTPVDNLHKETQQIKKRRNSLAGNELDVSQASQLHPLNSCPPPTPRNLTENITLMLPTSRLHSSSVSAPETLTEDNSCPPPTPRNMTEEVTLMLPTSRIHSSSVSSLSEGGLGDTSQTIQLRLPSANTIQNLAEDTINEEETQTEEDVEPSPKSRELDNTNVTETATTKDSC
jgi:solute carrier family 50 protein (sugar transporter)